MTDMTDEQIVEAWGSSARVHNKTLQVTEHTDVLWALEGKYVRDVIEFLQTLDEDATINIYTDTDYDNLEHAVVNVIGWTDVTPERRAKMIGTIRVRERVQRENDEREFHRLKRERPDLFDESARKIPPIKPAPRYFS